jgi:DNA-binding transcriptional LysR family regulator
LQDSGYVGRQLIGAGNEGLVASPKYLNNRGVPATLEDLVNHDCVSFGHPSGVTTWRLNGPNGVEEDVQITSRFNGNTAQALRKATVAGLGIALLPPTIVDFDLRAGRLVPVLPHYHRTGYGLHVLYPSRQHLPLAVSAFIGLVMEKLKVEAFPARVLPEQV